MPIVWDKFKSFHIKKWNKFQENKNLEKRELSSSIWAEETAEEKTAETQRQNQSVPDFERTNQRDNQEQEEMKK